MKVHTKINANVEYLKDKRILYAIVDQANVQSKHKKLFDKVSDLTHSFTSRLASSTVPGDVKYFNDIDDAMTNSNEYDIVLVQSVGNFIRHNMFFEYLNDYCKTNPDFFLIAFTLDWDSEKGTGWIECHNQMMVINVNTWKKIGCPKYGGWETVTELLPNHTRSIENFHDKYTPVWMKGETGHTLKLRSSQGWSFIKTAFEHGIRIDNFSKEMRDCRLYVYPDFDSENLYNSFLKQDSLLVTNPNQKKWISNFMRPKNTLWIYNSEPYYFNIDLSLCEVYFGPSAGFKFLDILNYNPQAKFVFYDYNQESVDWIKDLKENWDGDNFPKYLKSRPKEIQKLYKYINGSIENNQELLFRDFKGEENFKKLWNIFKNSKAEFACGSLFNDEWLMELLQHSKKLHTFFYYSNIFATDFTTIMFSTSEINEKYQNFLNIVQTECPGSVMYGSDPTGEWH